MAELKQINKLLKQIETLKNKNKLLSSNKASSNKKIYFKKWYQEHKDDKYKQYYDNRNLKLGFENGKRATRGRPKKQDNEENKIKRPRGRPKKIFPEDIPTGK